MWGWFFTGMILGSIIECVIFIVYKLIFNAFGTLRIDHSDPEKDIYRLDLNDLNDLDALNTKKRVILTIDHNADLSQK